MQVRPNIENTKSIIAFELNDLEVQVEVINHLKPKTYFIYHQL